MTDKFKKYLLFLLVLSVQTMVQAQGKVINDLGDEDDFSTSSDIYLIQFNWEGPNIPGKGSYGEFLHQEIPTKYRVFTEGPDTPGLIKARTIRMSTYAEFFTPALASGDSVYLGIRFKDNVPSLYGPEPVFAHNGSGFVKIGGLGGNFDHQWKAKVISVSTSAVKASNGKYRFKIGEGTYGRGLKSDLAVDRIEIAAEKALLNVEDDTRGYYPAENNILQGMNRNSPWFANDKPFFPIGLAAGWTGMSEARFQQVADAGFNTLLFYNWMNKERPYEEKNIWDVMPYHYGFTEFLDACYSRGLKTIGVFQHDIRYPVIPNYFNTEQECLDFISSVCSFHKNHPALLGWSPVDEPDHSGFPDFYAPLEWCMGVKDAIRKGDPNHPIYALEIGWRKGAFGHYKDIADYQGFDVYPAFGSSVKEIGNRADLLTEETSGEKPFIAFLKAYDRTAEQAYMSFAEVYLALIHGANGIFYWNLSGADPIWHTLSQIASEINQINPILLPPAYTLDVNGKEGICLENSGKIENIYKKGSDDADYIIAVNTENSGAGDVTFSVNNLEVGTLVQVLFEERTITPVAGAFTDNFSAYERHIYKINHQPATNSAFIPESKATFLSDNYPNPFRTSTRIKYKLSEECHVSLKILDTQGKEISTLVNKKQEAGQYQVTFKADSLAGGTYFYKLSAGKFSQTKKMTVQSTAIY